MNPFSIDLYYNKYLECIVEPSPSFANSDYWVSWKAYLSSAGNITKVSSFSAYLYHKFKPPKLTIVTVNLFLMPRTFSICPCLSSWHKHLSRMYRNTDSPAAAWPPAPPLRGLQDSFVLFVLGLHTGFLPPGKWVPTSVPYDSLVP